ncbi:hypothetical protein OUZ56_028875 [Daphnia magna]|uniref:Uncharacterized protein n=1 Tax=Daphnia magna TaxID=35525 RepID=A0ABR0B585_9CRUS|nr:hypothetical protein OUZ56_028875 [Daphnia magna]
MTWIPCLMGVAFLVAIEANFVWQRREINTRDTPLKFSCADVSGTRYNCRLPFQMISSSLEITDPLKLKSSLTDEQLTAAPFLDESLTTNSQPTTSSSHIGFFALRTPAARRGFLRLVVLCIRTPNPSSPSPAAADGSIAAIDPSFFDDVRTNIGGC